MTKKMLTSGLATTMILSALAGTALASQPLDCGIPLDVWNATSDPVPEGTVYEYTTDADGNIVLVGEEVRLECDIPLDVYNATSDPVPDGIVYEYTTDADGNIVLVGEEVAPDLTDAYDPNGAPVPEGVMFSPNVMGNLSWANTIFTNMASYIVGG